MATRLTTSLEPNDVFSYTSDQRFDLGGKGETPDGRKFRYVHVASGAAAVAGKLYQSAAEDAANWENVAIAAAAAGATTVVTTGAITAAKDLFAGGWLVVADDAGEGFIYKIAGNTAAAAAVCTITLEDPIVTALTVATTIDIIPNIYKNAEIWDATNHDGAILGVAVCPITANYYGWLQTGGITNVLCNGTGAVGLLGVASNGIDGAVEPATGGATETFVPLGHWVTGVTDTEYGAFMLNIE